MKLPIYIVAVVLMAGVGHTEPPKEAVSVLLSLKQRQPNWRSEIVKLYPNGTPESVLLYEPIFEGGEKPTKQLFFYEIGQIRTEVDIIAVDQDSPGAKAWKSTIVPHGARVDLSPEGQLQHTAEYRYGLNHGMDQIFLPIWENLHYKPVRKRHPRWRDARLF